MLPGYAWYAHSMTETLRYHEGTKHTPRSVRTSAHYLDWSTKPDPFKELPGLDVIPLPEPAPDAGWAAADAIVGRRAPRERELDLREMARILELGAGVLRERVFADGERFYFRTYASAGALYPLELYFACGDIDGLEAGLYHFHPLERALRRVRGGDPRPYIVRAAGARDGVARAPVTLILSGISRRTMWKYEARGYRHLYWDAGMVVANLLALAAAGGHGAEVVLGFTDRDVNLLLGVDGTTEMTLTLVPVGLAATDDGGTPRVEPAGSAADPLPRADEQPLETRRDDPLYLRAHEAGSLLDPAQAAEWARPSAPESQLPAVGPCPDALEDVVRRRGSSRAFARASISEEHLIDIVARARSALAGDWGPPLIEVALIVNAVDGMTPGAYRWSDDGPELLLEGDFRHTGYFLCLEQPLGGDGAATIFLLADLDKAIGDLGERGYRAAQLEAGIRAGRIYLAAYACRLGATGLTFYDDEVRKFFNTKMEPMLVVAVGRPARRRRLL